MVATYNKSIKHSLLYLTDVYSRDIIDMFSPILHLNASHLSIFSSLFSFVFCDNPFKPVMSAVFNIGCCFTSCCGLILLLALNKFWTLLVTLI